MSPEYSFHVKTDLPSDRVATAFARYLRGVNGVTAVEAYSPQELSQEAIAGLSFGQAYRYFRQREGIIQKEAARRANVDQSMLSKLESDIYNFKPRQQAIVGLIESFSWSKGDPRPQILLTKAAEGRKHPEDLLTLIPLL